MGFQGMVTSNGAAVLKLYSYYKLSNSYAQAGLLVKKCGCDTEIPVGDAFKQLGTYVHSVKLDESVIDESVRSVLRIKFETGLFENPYCDTGTVYVSMSNQEKSKCHRQ